MNDVKLVLKEFMGRNGGFAPHDQKMYSAYMESESGSRRLDSWECGGRGYSKAQYARQVLEPFSKILGVEITVEKI